MSLINQGEQTVTVPHWVTIEGKRFRAVEFETAVDTDIDTAWAELHGNYVNIQDIQAAIIDSYGLPGEPETGMGAVRHCDIDFNGKEVAIKERIIDLIELPDHREYTYDVYESKGFPARVYNTWRLRVGPRGETLLANVFYYRMQPAIMTRFMVGQITGAARGGVLGYKHFFETGERKTPAAEIRRRYAGV
jgi:hypothetical protein